MTSKLYRSDAAELDNTNVVIVDRPARPSVFGFSGSETTDTDENPFGNVTRINPLQLEIVAAHRDDQPLISRASFGGRVAFSTIRVDVDQMSTLNESQVSFGLSFVSTVRALIDGVRFFS